MNRLPIILILALAVVSCAKKEFPVEVVEPSIFKVQGSFGGQLLSFQPDGEGTFMFTEVEQHADEAFELITEFRNPDCDNCMEMLRFTWLLGVEEDDIAEELGEGDIEYFEGFDEDDIGFGIDLEGFESFDFQFWEINGEEFDAAPDFVPIDDDWVVDIGVFLTNDFGSCDQFFHYTFEVTDFCDPTFCHVSFDYEIEDNVLILYTDQTDNMTPNLWWIDDEGPFVVAGNQPFEWEFDDEEEVTVTLAPFEEPFLCGFSEHTRTVFLDDESDCVEPFFELFPLIDYDDATLLIEYVDEDGNYYTTSQGCYSFWFDQFEQPESSFFIITGSEEYQSNPQGLQTRRIEFEGALRLFNPENPLMDFIEVEDFGGTIAVALPD